MLRGAPYGSTTSYDLLASAAGLSYSADKLERLLGLEPWLPLSDSFSLKPTGSSLAEQSDAQVLASHTYDISEMPSTSLCTASRAAPAAAASC